MTEDQPALRIAFAPGVTVGKWTRRWAERHPEVPLEVFPAEEIDGVAALHQRIATLSFVRLPVARESLSVIPLYREVTVLVVSRDSELSTLETVTEAQTVDLPRVVEYSATGSVKDAVALVAAGVGFLRLPHSLARLHARKDVVAIPIEDAPGTEVALAWLRDETSDLIDEFVGIVRGRTAASSRGVQVLSAPSAKVQHVEKSHKEQKRQPQERQPRRAPGPSPRVRAQRDGGKTKKRGSR